MEASWKLLRTPRLGCLPRLDVPLQTPNKDFRSQSQDLPKDAPHGECSLSVTAVDLHDTGANATHLTRTQLSIRYRDSATTLGSSRRTKLMGSLTTTLCYRLEIGDKGIHERKLVWILPTFLWLQNLNLPRAPVDASKHHCCATPGLWIGLLWFPLRAWGGG